VINSVYEAYDADITYEEWDIGHQFVPEAPPAILDNVYGKLDPDFELAEPTDWEGHGLYMAFDQSEFVDGFA